MLLFFFSISQFGSCDISKGGAFLTKTMQEARWVISSARFPAFISHVDLAECLSETSGRFEISVFFLKRGDLKMSLLCLACLFRWLTYPVATHLCKTWSGCTFPRGGASTWTGTNGLKSTECRWARQWPRPPRSLKIHSFTLYLAFSINPVYCLVLHGFCLWSEHSYSFRFVTFQDSARQTTRHQSR